MTDNKITLTEDDTALKSQQTRSANIEDDDDDYVEYHFQEKPHDDFSWATLTYMWLISSWFMTTLGIFLMQKVLPKFYRFDPLSAKTTVFQDPSLDLIVSTLYIFGIILIGYYIVGRNKPYWMNPRNLCESKSLMVFFLLLLTVKSFVGGAIFSILPSTVQATDDTMSAFTEYGSFKSAYGTLTGGDDDASWRTSTSIKPLSPDSIECKRRNKSVLKLIKMPMTSPSSGLMRRVFVTSAMDSGCLSMSDGYDLAKELKNRALSIRYPHQYFLELLKPEFKKVDNLIPNKIMFTTQEWCLILANRDMPTDKNTDTAQGCRELSQKSLTALPKEKNFTQFYEANKNRK